MIGQSSSSGRAVRARALALHRRPRGATPVRLPDFIRCHFHVAIPIADGIPISVNIYYYCTS
jgi:hypothetical protein